MKLKRRHDRGRVGKRKTFLTSPAVPRVILVCDTTGGVRSSRLRDGVVCFLCVVMTGVRVVMSGVVFLVCFMTDVTYV